MSTQGDKLKAIADAIREVDGTDEPIVANDFPNRIRAISPGVKSFNGRTGDVVPADGDYTAEQVGALPLNGGKMKGVIIDLVARNSTSANNNLKTEQSGISVGAASPVSGVTSLSIRTDGERVYISPESAKVSSLLCRVSGIAAPIYDSDAVNLNYFNSHSISIASNAGAHNSIFRGKNLGTAVTAAQYAAIAAGTFDDLFIGDYWTINNINWRIAAFDYYLGTGSTELTTHHAVIVPDENLDTQKMNDTNVTTGGYVGSKMYTANIATARTKVNTAFSGHVLTHQFYLSNAVTNGKVSGSTNVNQDVVLMSERNVYGQTIMSSECNDGYTDIGWRTYDRTQFPLFALAPEFIQKQRSYYWLRDVVNELYFANVYTDGNNSYTGASNPCGVRPAFSIHG